MKIIMKLIAVLLLSMLIGGGGAIYQLKTASSGTDFMIKNGCWRVNPKMDLKANDFQRSLVAMVGLFALRESEVLYFIASEDSNGEPLSSQYNYELVGSYPDARYWSYTIYGEDHFLIANEQNVYSYNLDDISYIAKDTLNPEIDSNVRRAYTINISSNSADENWLPSGDEDQLHILLRLYNPSPSVYNNLAGIALPEIRRKQQ